MASLYNINCADLELTCLAASSRRKGLARLGNSNMLSKIWKPSLLVSTL